MNKITFSRTTLVRVLYTGNKRKKTTFSFKLPLLIAALKIQLMEWNLKLINTFWDAFLYKGLQEKAGNISVINKEPLLKCISKNISLDVKYSSAYSPTVATTTVEWFEGEKQEWMQYAQPQMTLGNIIKHISTSSPTANPSLNLQRLARPFLRTTVFEELSTEIL